MSTHNVLSYAKRIDEICLGEWWQSSDITLVPNTLNRKFKPVQPNHVWSSDITYIWTGKTWSYLAVVLDLYARRVIAWSMSAQADQYLVIKALDEAWHRRGRPAGVIFHSDQGKPQYKSYLIRQRLNDYDMQQSMSRKGLAQYTVHGTMPQQSGSLEVSRLNGFLKLDTVQLKKRN